MTKKSNQKCKYLVNQKSFEGELKSIFYHFWRASSCQKLFQTLECTFKAYKMHKENSSFNKVSIELKTWAFNENEPGVSFQNR